jgi:hypothetical protein
MTNIIQNLHIGERMALLSLLTSSLCFYPVMNGDKLLDRDHIAISMLDDTISPYFLFSIAITVPMMIEALFDLYFGVLPRKINTCRISLMSALFVYSLLLYIKYLSEYNAEFFFCYIQARSSIATTAMLSFTMLEESTTMMKYYSIFLAIIVNSTALIRVTVVFYIHRSSILVLLFGFFTIIFICTSIFLLLTYRKWIIQKTNIMSPEETFTGISVLIFIVVTFARLLVFAILYLLTGDFPFIATIPMSSIKAVLVIELIGVLAILIVPGRIVGHYATANKVSSLPSISYSIVYLLHAYR